MDEEQVKPFDLSLILGAYGFHYNNKKTKV